MGNHEHALPPVSPRFGSCLEHGIAHAADHACWSRRDFLSTLGLVACGSTLMLGQTPLQAFGQTSLLRHLRRLETDRVLVLIQMSGGNDGLNTIIPVDNDLYYNARPQLAISKNTAVPLPDVDELRFHPSFDALTPLYGDGEMTILQNVGYPSPDLSHFASTDIWLSANTTAEEPSTGWLGRYLDVEYPNFAEIPPEYPLAVQIGGFSSLLFQGPSANMSMSLATVELFERLTEGGTIFDVESVPDTTYGTEMAFVRTVANDSFFYADAVQAAGEAGTNSVEYPSLPNRLAQDLAVVARLIKGRLGARIYHVSIGGFDTHADQSNVHATLLRYLAEAVNAFLEDLAADGMAEDVLVMTFSEFGRRVQQNASLGTDHGTAAPLFLFGEGVTGGLLGQAPDLSDLDDTGNLKFEIDFRSVYATVLQDWFGLDAATTESVLGGAYNTLGFVADPATPTSTDQTPVPKQVVLHQNYPNPFNPSTTITYEIDRPAHVRLRVYDVRGRLVQTLVDGIQAAGSHTVSFNAGHLPSGTYLYRLEAGHRHQTRRMVLIR